MIYEIIKFKKNRKGTSNPVNLITGYHTISLISYLHNMTP